MGKVVSAEFAASLVQDGVTLAVGGFTSYSVPEALLYALRQRHAQTQSPQNLTLMHVAAVGDGKTKGCNHLDGEGLVSRFIGGHVGLEPALGKRIHSNEIEAHLLPQGVVSHLLRAAAGKKPGIITHVGLKTFADPRLDGCKVNQAARDSGLSLSRVMEIDGQEYLFYKTVPVDICFIRATVGDENGNLSMELEPCVCDQMEMAMAVRNNGGIVIAQVDRLAKACTLDPRMVAVHRSMVDYVVVGAPEHSPQSIVYDGYLPEVTGVIQVPVADTKEPPLDHRMICGRRGAMELKAGDFVNLGLGIPTEVGVVAGLEGIIDSLSMSIESGVIGGVPLSGAAIGATVNGEAVLKQADTFDFYDGGGIDMTCLGAAQIDAKGNVNVSCFAGRVVGPGGFINISQNAKKVCFMGTFVPGLKAMAQDGKLTITKAGAGTKFVKELEQVSYSGEYGAQTGQEVLYITERAVFRLTADGIMLTEIAQGMDLEKDILAYMEFKPLIAPDLKLMDQRIFQEGSMGLEA